MKKKRNRRLLLQIGLIFFLISLLLWVAQTMLVSTSTMMGYIGGQDMHLPSEFTPEQMELLTSMMEISIVTGTILIVVFSGVLLVCIWLLVLKPLKKVQHIVRDFTDDKNTEKTSEMLSQIKSRNEIGALADDVGDMVQNLQDYTARIEQMTAEKERLRTELDIAKKVQESQLPAAFPAFPDREDFDLYAAMKPAKEVGGDFYDYFMIDENRLAMVIADVSDKGIPAALFMMVSKALITSRIRGGDSPSEALTSINRQLSAQNNAHMFVTVWLAIIDLETGRGIASNAGHEHPSMLKSADQTWSYLVYRHSPGVAMKKNMTFEQHEFVMDAGDSLFVYTDGVTEARNRDGEMYNQDRLLETLNRHTGEAPRAVIEAVEQDLAGYIGEEDPFDDMTMLCFQYRGKEKR